MSIEIHNIKTHTTGAKLPELIVAGEDRGEIQQEAQYLRQRGHSVRVCQRNVKAGGVIFTLHLALVYKGGKP